MTDSDARVAAYLQQAAQEAWNVEGIGDDLPRRKVERVGSGTQELGRVPA